MAHERRARRNQEISTSNVRVIGESGEQVGVMTLNDAIEQAQSSGLDLVEVSPNSNPPVCRVMDYGKFVFEQNKKAQVAKRKQKQIQVKEIKFRPVTDEGDYQVKLRSIIKFLVAGDKVKVTMRFRGREMAHQEIGLDLLKRVEQDLLDVGVVEQQPEMEGRQMIMIFSPKRGIS
ncbi:MAG: translation initiation factor IF-3 [Pseudomonadota bacterium]|nr:translation initiation factor IF-3 [Gammaproteobacteria bacterium]MEE2683938.1 translation initiation factor IF-3 [Pseudomonadota bacterium]